jgi:hypothetical protein
MLDYEFAKCVPNTTTACKLSHIARTLTRGRSRTSYSGYKQDVVSVLCACIVCGRRYSWASMRDGRCEHDLHAHLQGSRGLAGYARKSIK